MRRSILRRAVPRLVRRLSAYDLLPAYDYVQNVVEWHLNKYIDKLGPDDVRSIYIVGGYLGNEIPFLLRRYRQARIKVFEASRRYQEELIERFPQGERVSIIKAAASDQVGTALFRETNLRGSGSLLEVGALAAETYGTRAAEVFEVPTVTIDSVSGDEAVDCLWVDVQGAELLVLRGAVETLLRTRAVFSEVSVKADLYKGGVTLDELEGFLGRLGFRMILLGLDAANFTGNALFVRTGPDVPV